MHASPDLPSNSIPRLLQVVHALYPQAIGGVETYVWEAARALGGAVLVLQPASQPYPEWEGLDIHTAAPGESAQMALNRVVTAVAPEVVLVQHLGNHSPGILMGLRERDIPYAVFLHDYTATCPSHRLWHRTGDPCGGPGRTGLKCALCISGSWKRAAEVPVRAFLYRHRPQDWHTALARADAIIANSRYLRDFWIEQGAPPERLAVIAPRIPRAVEPPEEFVPGARPSALYAGGWGEAKGAEFLAAASDELRDDWQFEFPGGLSDQARQQFRDALDERHATRFPGPMPSLTLQQLMRSSDLTVVPSRWQETYSRIASESLEAGRPVVATAVGGIPERIIHGVNGFLASAELPPSLAQSMEEALATPWNAAEVQAHTVAEAEDAVARLRRLLCLMRGNAWSEPALALEYGDFLTHAADIFELTPADAQRRLTEAMRELSPWIDTVEDRAFALAVEMLSRHRRVYLNHALALFRAAGCRQVLDLHAGLGDAARWFAAWGLTARIEDGEPRLVHLAESLGARRAEPDFIPDAVFVNQGAPDDDPRLLRMRFPQARVIAVETDDGVDVVE